MTTNFWPETWQEHRDRKGMFIQYHSAKQHVRDAGALCQAISQRFLSLYCGAQCAAAGKPKPQFDDKRVLYLSELIELFAAMQDLPNGWSTITVRESAWRDARDAIGDTAESLERLRAIDPTATPSQVLITWLGDQWNHCATAGIRLMQQEVRSACFG